MNRQYLISDTTIRIIKRELELRIKPNTVITPETDAGFKQILGILDNLKGA